MSFNLRARRYGMSQTLSVDNGLTRKPISDCCLCVVTFVRKAPNHQNTFIVSAPQQHNMRGLQEAPLECDNFASEDEIPWSRIAAKHGAVRSTLTRTWRSETRSRKEQAIAQQKLTP
jgi:hypothetical protein